MPKQIQKTLQKCLSKIKISNKRIQLQLHGCKRPKTPSVAVSGEKEDDAVTLSDIDRFLFENFRSLYQKEFEEEDIRKKNEAKTAPFLFKSRRLLGSPPPENISGSPRFFVPSGSRSSLIIDEASSSSSSGTIDSSLESEEAEEIEADGDSSTPDDFIALLTYSPSPYEDFRRSMQEIVDARVEHNGKVDWEFLQELLFCYLDLNNKKFYRYVLRAFVDLIVVFRENSGGVPASLQPCKGAAERKRLN